MGLSGSLTPALAAAAALLTSTRTITTRTTRSGTFRGTSKQQPLQHRQVSRHPLELGLALPIAFPQRGILFPQLHNQPLQAFVGLQHPRQDGPQFGVNTRLIDNASQDRHNDKRTPSRPSAHTPRVSCRPQSPTRFGTTYIEGTPNSSSNGSMGLADHLDAAVEQGASYAQFVIYNLPGRDCSALASNGELQPDEIDRYQSEYIDPIAEIMSDSKYAQLRIITIVEIDSLPNLITNTTDRGAAGTEPSATSTPTLTPLTMAGSAGRTTSAPPPS